MVGEDEGGDAGGLTLDWLCLALTEDWLSSSLLAGAGTVLCPVLCLASSNKPKLSLLSVSTH